jgi:hypothetical protein
MEEKTCTNQKDDMSNYEICGLDVSNCDSSTSCSDYNDPDPDVYAILWGPTTLRSDGGPIFINFVLHSMYSDKEKAKEVARTLSPHYPTIVKYKLRSKASKETDPGEFLEWWDEDGTE